MVKSRRAVYQFHVSLKDIEPAIWRRVQLWEDTRLPTLHRIVQWLFRWEDYHVHEFIVGRRTYAEPDPEDNWFGLKMLDETDVRLSTLGLRVGDEIEYHYDFGNNWRHRLLLEAILLPESEAFYPRCIAGERSGPPEDSGGPHSYPRYLEALADPGNPQHEEMLAWRGPFDPEQFSLRDVNASLHRTFYRRPKGSVHFKRTGRNASA